MRGFLRDLTCRRLPLPVGWQMIAIFLASACLGLILALVFYAWHDRTDW